MSEQDYKLPDLPVPLIAHDGLRRNCMILLPNSNPQNLSPEEMIKQSEAVISFTEPIRIDTFTRVRGELYRDMLSQIQAKT